MNSNSFFENPWVVSICSGIIMYSISSLLLFLSKNNKGEKFILSLTQLATFSYPKAAKKPKTVPV
jgi:hypothetical protein